MDTVIVRYGELTLKGENVRGAFEDLLIKSIKRAIGEKCIIERERGRIFLKTGNTVSVAKRISKLPGVVSTSPAVSTDSGMNDIVQAVLNTARKKLRSGKSFAVRTTRSGDHPFSSMDVNREVGSALLEDIRGARVDLTSPDVEVGIEVRGEKAYIYTNTFPGTGGLPSGSQGKAVALMTGKLHDALAVYLAAKRGASVLPVFVHLGMKSDDAAQKKVLSQITLLRAVDHDMSLLTVRVSPKKVDVTDDVLKREMKIMEAFRIAADVGASGVISGDTLDDIVGSKDRRTERWKGGQVLLMPVAGLDDETIGVMMKRSGLRRNLKISKGRKMRGAGI